MSEPKSLEDREFQIAIGILEDSRKLIAAGKVQRWDVLKWSVSVNLALIVAVAAPALSVVRVPIVVLSFAVAATGALLIWHYNRRMARTRAEQIVHVIDWLRSKGVDCDRIAGESTRNGYATGEFYDHQELKIFFSVLVASPVLVLLAWLLS